jgi:hypothetical protein
MGVVTSAESIGVELMPPRAHRPKDAGAMEYLNEEHVESISGVVATSQLSAKVKDAVVTGYRLEGHLPNISSVVVTSQLSAWFTSEQAWQELKEF